ncbi:serine hydrolase [Kibdelosporangium aridum]|uniref:hypothetical protein n=1 Tax=Kibdelosporangium aridum TaxID=2030 RepID=UPI00117B1D33|nr:hypothetical protein [Kibdelosporangium aridum]
MRRTQWTIVAAAVTAAATLGLIGCAATKAGPEPLQELPLQTGSGGEVSQAPSEWANPPAAAPGDPAPTKRSPGALGISVNVQQVVRQTSRNATAAAVVVDRDSGTELVSQNADRQFYAGSLVKLLVAVDAFLYHPDDPQLRRQINTMIRLSDDHICNQLWMDGGGGRAIIGRMTKAMGLTGTEPPKTRPGQWGDTLITAHDLVRIYDYIVDEAPATIRMDMLAAMGNAAKFGSDDFFQHFGIPSAVNKHWAIKQAWTDNSQAVSVHSTGLVDPQGRRGTWRYTVILLTEHPKPQTYEAAAKSATEAAQAVAPLLEP